MIEIKNFINGEFIAPISNKYIDNYAPAKGEIFSFVPDSDSRDVERAVEAAKIALPIWSGLTIGERSKRLNKLADLIEKNLEKFAIAESLDTGKPIALTTETDIPRAAANFRFFAAAIVNFSSAVHLQEGEAINYTRRSPVGIIGAISPWNLPLYLFTWKIAPALATGNCVIAKPSELTPYTAYLLGELINEAELTPGCINILHGLGKKVGQAIVDHDDTKAITFTGGTGTGKIIGESAAKKFKKVSLELGGKNPTVIFDDCDFEDAVDTTVRSSFTNQGEICLCGSRIIVQSSIYERFKEAFINKVSALKKGDPAKFQTEFGALISKEHRDKVLSYIDLAKSEGGKILTGGNQYIVKGLNGWFVSPTVIENLEMSCRVNQEEIFGPVVTLIPFNYEEEAINLANDSKYGLATSIWTSDVKKAHRVAHKIQCGIVWVNCWMLRDLRTPFGGMKQSGVGREGGDDALRFFTEPQNICIKL